MCTKTTGSKARALPLAPCCRSMPVHSSLQSLSWVPTSFQGTSILAYLEGARHIPIFMLLRNIHASLPQNSLWMVAGLLLEG